MKPRPAAMGRGEKVLVMGLGSFGGGVGAARYLHGLGAQVTVTDLRGPETLGPSLERIRALDVRTVLGEHRPGDFESCDVVVVNPAVRPDHPLVRTARQNGARITSEIELFLQAVRARVVGVTGTQGKSSTCHLLHGLLEAGGQRAHLGGNIGGSLLESLPGIAPDDVCVVELSSYQLEGLSADQGNVLEIAVVTNVLADHLERHGSPEAYYEAKARIGSLVRPGGTLVHPARLRDLVRRTGRDVQALAHGPQADIRHDEHGFWLGDTALAPLEALHLPGDFQRENAAVALAVAHLIGTPAERLPTCLEGLGGLSHRAEPLGLRAERHVIDNGVSTTPDSTASVLRSLPHGTTVLCGGRAKALSWEPVLAEAKRLEARVIAFGQSGPDLGLIFDAAGVPCQVRKDLQQAVDLAFQDTRPGDTILFSPACASFDAYPNFRARALEFRQLLPEGRSTP